MIVMNYNPNGLQAMQSHDPRYFFNNGLPFLNVPGQQFLLDLIKLSIPIILIPFIMVITLIIVFPETMRFTGARRFFANVNLHQQLMSTLLPVIMSSISSEL